MKNFTEISQTIDKNKIIWVTWENQRRNRELSRQIGAKIYEWAYIDEIKNPIKKYSLGIIKTAALIAKIRPKLVFCQNPSIVLALFLSLLGKITKISVIVDSHNAGIYPLEGRSTLLQSVSKIIQKCALLTIVTNGKLKEHIERNGGKAFVLPDPLPVFSKVNKRELPSAFNILFICSFAEDEPYEKVFTAGKILPNAINIYVTGNYKKKKIDPTLQPSNVILLGYVNEEDFVSLLHSVDLIIDLTERENCLVCGAYESVAAEKPMVLSDTAALRSYFNKGVIYTKHSPRALKKSILDAKKDYKRLSKEIIELKHEKLVEWYKIKNHFLQILKSSEKVNFKIGYI